MSKGKNETKRLVKKRLMTAFEWKTFFVWRVTYICVHVTQAQILPTLSKHVSPGMRFLGLGIGGLSHQSCMSLHIGTNNIVGGSIKMLSNLIIPVWNVLVDALSNYFNQDYTTIFQFNVALSSAHLFCPSIMVSNYLTQLDFNASQW